MYKSIFNYSWLIGLRISPWDLFCQFLDPCIVKFIENLTAKKQLSELIRIWRITIKGVSSQEGICVLIIAVKSRATASLSIIKFKASAFLLFWKGQPILIYCWMFICSLSHSHYNLLVQTTSFLLITALLHLAHTIIKSIREYDCFCM